MSDGARSLGSFAAGQGVEHTLSDGSIVILPPHDDFYAQMTIRNAGIISADEQAALRQATFLIAGCGSVGGAVIEPLVRMGAERLILAEPGEYDLHNLNRQSTRLQDIGRNKAEVHRERMLDINPYADIQVHTDGITSANVEQVVRDAAIILDGVDVTTQPPLRAKLEVHEQAQRFGVPVISGYDIAGLQLLKVYDYRNPKVKVLDGKIDPAEIDEIAPMVFLRKVVPIAALPHEIVGTLSEQLSGEREGFPQVVYTANLYGVLAQRAALDLLAGRPVKRQVIVDVHQVIRPRREKARVGMARLKGLYHLNNDFRRYRKATQAAQAGTGEQAAQPGA